MGKAVLIHGIVDQDRLFICAGGMLYKEKIGGILQKRLIIMYNNMLRKAECRPKYGMSFSMETDYH